jgi:hypothetical protein
MKNTLLIAILVLSCFATRAQISSATTVLDLGGTFIAGSRDGFKKWNDKVYYLADSSYFSGSSILVVKKISEIVGTSSSEIARVPKQVNNTISGVSVDHFFKNKVNGKYMYLSGRYIYSGTGGTLSYVDTVSGNGFFIVEHGAGYYIMAGANLYYYDFNTLVLSQTMPGTKTTNLTSNGQSVYTMTYGQIGNSSDYMYYLNKYKAGVHTVIDSASTNNFVWGSAYDYSFPIENVSSIVMGLGPNSYYVDDNDAITPIPNQTDIVRDYGVINGKHIFCDGASGIKAFDKTTKTITQLALAGWIPSKEVARSATRFYIPDYDSTLTVTDGTVAGTKKLTFPPGTQFGSRARNYGLCGDDYVTIGQISPGSKSVYSVLKLNGTSYNFDSLNGDATEVFPKTMVQNSQGLYSIHQASNSPVKDKICRINPCTGTLAVENITTEHAVNIYPNPVQNSLTIKSANLGLDVTVYDILGKKMYSQKGANNSVTINTELWHNGIYFVQCNGITHKVVKQ